MWRLTHAEFWEQCRIDPDIFVRWQKFFPKAHVRVKAGKRLPDVYDHRDEEIRRCIEAGNGVSK